MFGVGFPELLVVMLVVLLVLGPEKLPEAASKLGQALGFIQRSGEQLRRELHEALPPLSSTPLKDEPPLNIVSSKPVSDKESNGENDDEGETLSQSSPKLNEQ